MFKEALVFEVTDASYGKYVLRNSHRPPVLLAFIGAWSEHCYALTIMFTRLAKEFAEQFVFSKLDIDESPEAKEKYEIKNVPKNNPDYKEGAAREMIVSVINTLATNNPKMAQLYRRQLSSMLKA